MKSEAKPSGGNPPPAEPLLQASQGEELRELIARLIDPWAWRQCEWAARDDNDEVLREYLPKREASLAKADAILSLTSRCARCGATRAEHDQEVVGLTCPDREGVFVDALQASQARCRVLEEAIMPFADAARAMTDLGEQWNILLRPRDYASERCVITVNDFRKALSTLGGRSDG